MTPRVSTKNVMPPTPSLETARLWLKPLCAPWLDLTGDEVGGLGNSDDTTCGLYQRDVASEPPLPASSVDQRLAFGWREVLGCKRLELMTLPGLAFGASLHQHAVDPARIERRLPAATSPVPARIQCAPPCAVADPRVRRNSPEIRGAKERTRTSTPFRAQERECGEEGSWATRDEGLRSLREEVRVAPRRFVICWPGCWPDILSSARLVASW
jgi:hypothetical protein